MSTFRCEVVPVVLRPHPNADSLSLVEVFGFTAIVRTAEWQGRDRGVYVPVDAVLPDRPEFAFLAGHRRIKAKRLRGIFSMGLLVPAPDGAQVGDDVTALIGAVKYEPPEETAVSTGGEDAPAPPGLAPTYTDIESLRRYAHAFDPGEPVIATEKIHGANMRLTLRDGMLHVGSRTRWKRMEGNHVWAKAATGLAERMARLPPCVVVYGEAFGQVQDLRYGTRPGEVRFRAFDVAAQGRYLDDAEMRDLLGAAGFTLAPTVYRGPFDFAALAEVAERDSITAPGQLSEGIVVRPERERFHPEIGRVILKLHSQRYLLRKGA